MSNTISISKPPANQPDFSILKTKMADFLMDDMFYLLTDLKYMIEAEQHRTEAGFTSLLDRCIDDVEVKTRELLELIQGVNHD